MYVGLVIGYINTVFLFPYILSIEEYGLFRLIIDSGVFLSLIFAFGASNALMKFFPEFRGKSEQRLFYSLLMILLISSFIQMGLANFLSEEFTEFIFKSSGRFHEFFDVVLIFALLFSVNTFLENYLKTYMEVEIPVFMQSIGFRVLLLSLGFIYFFGWVTIDVFLQGIFIVMACYLVITFFFFTQKKDFSFTPFKIINIDSFKKIINYSAYMFMGASGMMVVGKIDSLMVGREIGLEATAIYAVAFFIAVTIEMPKRILSQLLLPIISNAFNRNDFVEVASLYRKSATNQLLIGMLIFILIWSNIDDFFNLIPKDAFEKGKYVTLIIGILKLFNMSLGINNEIISYSSLYRWYTYFLAILIFFTIGSNLILIPMYGLEGAAIATFLSVGIFNVLKVVLIRLKLNMHPFEKNQLTIIFIGILLSLLYFIPLPFHSIISIAIKSLFILIIYCFSMYFLNVSTDANEWINKHIKLLKSKI
ncbi:MAG TPA: polysaccharide biosynthesis protein [Bacteroidetes bacterium]|nr:polysaccharide biosynthesis protein [Bacteroidota bacterium]